MNGRIKVILSSGRILDFLRDGAISLSPINLLWTLENFVAATLSSSKTGISLYFGQSDLNTIELRVCLHRNQVKSLKYFY